LISRARCRIARRQFIGFFIIPRRQFVGFFDSDGRRLPSPAQSAARIIIGTWLTLGRQLGRGKGHSLPFPRSRAWLPKRRQPRSHNRLRGLIFSQSGRPESNRRPSARESQGAQSWATAVFEKTPAVIASSLPCLKLHQPPETAGFVTEIGTVWGLTDPLPG
jgi:hypothetical protein